MGKLFGTDGIRGAANEYPLTADGCFGIGRAVASFFSCAGPAHQNYYRKGYT